MTGSFVLFSTIHGIGAGHLEPTRPSHVMSASTPWPSNVKVPRAHEGPELLYHESVFKRRFCATFPKVETCQRGDLCAFAHSREEVRVELLQPEEEKFMVDWISAKASLQNPATVDFFTRRFKTLWCPYGTKHGWHECLYAHTDQDWRRRPELGYSSEPCPEWAKHVGEKLHYDERCPNGLRCRFAHGSKEQLYHPLYYKTMPCTDWASSGTCPRGPQCAFFHGPEEQRHAVTGLYDAILKCLCGAKRRCGRSYSRGPVSSGG